MITGQAVAAYAGPAIVFSLVLTGLVVALSALCYAEMAAIAIGWSAYMQCVIGDFGLHHPARWASLPLALQGQALIATATVVNLTAVLIIFLVTLSHLAGLRESGRFNSLTVVLKRSSVVSFITCGLAHAHFANWMPIPIGRFTRVPAATSRDPFEALDDLMTVIEALCPVWPKREIFSSTDRFLI